MVDFYQGLFCTNGSNPTKLEFLIYLYGICWVSLLIYKNNWYLKFFFIKNSLFKNKIIKHNIFSNNDCDEISSGVYACPRSSGSVVIFVYRFLIVTNKTLGKKNNKSLDNHFKQKKGHMQ